METKPNVALLGLGIMGRGMGVNLLKAGYNLTVYNRTAAKAQPLAEAGARVAESPAAAARGAAVVIAMLSDDAASRAAWLGPEGALDAMAPDGLVIDCGTLSPGWIAELAAAASERGLRLLEAPVTGSRTQAAAGQLKFLCGADAETLARATPLLRSMGREIIHLGPVGSGAQMKLINNFLCGVQAASFAEALAWIERSGLNRETAIDFLKNGAPASGILNAMADRMTRRDYEVNFVLRLMAKDLRYACAAAEQKGVNLTLSAASEALFRRAIEAGHGEKDMAAVVEALRDWHVARSE